MTTQCPICRDPGPRPAWTLRDVPFLRCPDCRCVFAGVRRNAEFWKRLYNDGYHETRLHGGADASVDHAKAKTFEAFFQLIPLPREGKRLLEVGCGTGEATAVAARMGFNATGIDLSETAVERARERFPHLEFRAGELVDGEAPGDGFDAVAAFDMIEHVEDPHPFTQQLARYVKPDGVVLFVTPNADSWSARALGARWFHSFDEHVTLYTPEALDRLMRQYGFSRIRGGFAWKRVSPLMLERHARTHEHIFGGRALARSIALLPTGLRSATFPFNIGEFYGLYRRERKGGEG